MAQTGKRPSILIFGESSVGKSSLVNMLVGQSVAPIGNSSGRCTFDSREYQATLQDGNRSQEFSLWDTLGMDDDTKSPLPEEGLRNLEDLMGLVEASSGFSLLIYCMKAQRLSRLVGQNVDLFWRVICKKAVPLVVVVTGLESEDDMEQWWTENNTELIRCGLPSDEKFGHACITTTRGKPSQPPLSRVYDTEFDESRKKVVRLIMESSSKQLWRPQRNGLTKEVGNFVSSTRPIASNVPNEEDLAHYTRQMEDWERGVRSKGRPRLIGSCGCQVQ